MYYFIISSFYLFSQLIKPGSWCKTSPFSYRFFFFSFESFVYSVELQLWPNTLSSTEPDPRAPGEGLHAACRSNLSGPLRAHRGLCTAHWAMLHKKTLCSWLSPGHGVALPAKCKSERLGSVLRSIQGPRITATHGKHYSWPSLSASLLLIMCCL